MFLMMTLPRRQRLTWWVDAPVVSALPGFRALLRPSLSRLQFEEVVPHTHRLMLLKQWFSLKLLTVCREGGQEPQGRGRALPSRTSFFSARESLSGTDER